MIQSTVTALLVPILFQLLCLSLSQSSIQYTITPDNIPKNRSCYNCLTFQQFAANISDHLNDSTTLILQPGRHLLSLDLVVFNSTSFNIHCLNKTSCTLQCNQNGRLIFDSVHHVHIRNIDLLECFGSKAVTVENFTLLKTTFTGSVHITSGTALEIVKSTALFSDCSFTKYIYGTYRWTITSIPRNTFAVHRTKKWIGGALILIHSNITIIKGNFTQNRAQIGGAIYAENGTIVIINKSKFVYNAANSSFYLPEQTAAGGALYATNNCSIFVYDSHFERNQVYEGYRIGGTIAIYQGLIHVIGSTLSNSVAYRGGVVYLAESFAVLNQSNLSSSSANDGGALYSVNSSLTFEYILLIYNKAQRGGAVFVSDSTIEIQKCMFASNFAGTGNGYGGAIYATNMKSVLLANSSLFKNNSAEFGAAMHINSINQEIQLQKCMFLYNKALTDGGVFYLNPSYKLSRMYSSRGLFVTIKQTKFHNNEAMGNGGVIHCESYDHNKLIIEDIDTIYESNQANNGGVMYISDCVLKTANAYIAFNIAFQKGIVLLSYSKVTYSDCVTFHNNFASAITITESEIYFTGRVNFTANEDMNRGGQQSGGAITSIFSVLTFNGFGIFSKNRAGRYGGAISSINSILRVLGNTELISNWATEGGGIYLYQSELLCRNQISFIENHANISGGGIHSTNSFIILSSRGSLLFMRNSAELGGGIFLTRSSKIKAQDVPKIIDGISVGTIRLIHNSAQYGGGIYNDDDTSPLTCTMSKSPGPAAESESECFFQAQAILGLDQKRKYLLFNLNEASEGGSDVYGGLFINDRCIPSLYSSTFRSVTYLEIVSNIKNLSLSVSSKPVQVCFCRNNQPDCGYHPSQKNVTKGEEFTLELVAVDQANNTLAAKINAMTSSPRSRLGLGQQIQHAFDICTTLTYEVYSNNPAEKLILYADGPCQSANLSLRSVHVHFMPCQCKAGFVVSPKSKSACECICHKKLEPYLKDCNSSTSLLVRNSRAWIDIVNLRNNVTKGYLVHKHCPYDYCFSPSSLVQINLNVEGGADAQCAFNRSGILCGACKPSFSLALGSSKCLQCSNYWLFLLIPFCLAGIALVALLLVLNINVSKGTLNSIVFYSNIVIANRAILIPLQKYNFLAMLISWLSLDLGIETCFVNGLDAYSKTWLQFFFPTYIFILVFVLIIICQFSQKFSNLLGGRNPIATLATLVWLSNAKYFRTVLSVVSFTYLTYPNNHTELLWLPDGNVHYFKGKHIPLFLVSLFILVAAIVYILVLLSWQWLVRLPKCKLLFCVRNTKFMSLMDAFHAPYKAKHRYWPGLLLLVSMVQYFISASNTSGNPAVNLFAIIILVAVLTVYKGVIAGVYKSWPLDILESTIHINLILLPSSTMYITETGGNQAVLANISLGIIFITFILIIGYHILVLLFGDKTTAHIKRLLIRDGQRSASGDDDILDEFDRDSHQLINYNASKDDESDHT